MKLPFEFGTKLVFRLALPGFVLGAALAPMIFAFAKSIGVEVDKLEVLAIGTVFWGWAIVLADTPIYMLYEGRRFWPRVLFEWGIRLEKKRLTKLNRDFNPEMRQRDRRRFQESTVEALNFPIGDADAPEVRYPTRLGNLITAYETYPKAKYGLDAIFYWPRLWAVLDKDMREEVDNQQAIADSSVYMSLALYLGATIAVCYAAANGLFKLGFPNLPSAPRLLLLATGLAAAAYGIYRIALPAHAQFGELFKAIFDQHRKKLAFDDIAERIGGIVGDSEALKRPESERYQAVSRFLRWHRIRPPSEARNYTPKEWADELEKRAATKEAGGGDPPCG